MRKSILKWAFITLGGLVLVLVGVGWILHEPLPEGQPGPEADELAEAMLEAIDLPAWDTTGYVSWTFTGGQSYEWDRERNWVAVSWKEHLVLLDLDEVSGLAYTNDQLVEGDKAGKLIQKAWSSFCNDSFWLHAPAKAFDPGTERSIVQLEDGSRALMITYTSGGVTPGDSYLWILDENNRPVAWKMWVQIIPIGGVEFTWEAWERLPTGAQVATIRKGGLLDLSISNLQAASNIQQIYPDQDLFQELANSKK